ncbi:MAG: hypothetical protein ACI9SG_000027 [Maribacter sp.]|jgi:hypothetical protein
MKLLFYLICCTFLGGLTPINAQIQPGVYITDTKNIRHEIKVSDDYFIYSAYKTSPPEFIRTLGGFVLIEKTAVGEQLVVLLEFNSDYERDSIRQLHIPTRIEGDTLHLNWFEKLKLTASKKPEQDLDGTWLFATRGPDEGQERRGEANTRKTLKYLQDGRFQWIAYDTNGLQFKGTGGGKYTSIDGIYTENIEYFSKDNTRVGARLEFNYEIKGDDWHHTGKNSKGAPMYEIWSRRPTGN